MKKIICLLLTGALMFGCSPSAKPLVETSENAVKLQTPDNALVTIGNSTITSQDYFDALMVNFGGGESLNVAIGAIADEKLNNDELVAYIEEKMVEYREDESTYASIIENYETEEAFIENYFKAVAQRELLQKAYVNENYERLALLGKFRKGRVITTDVESVAMEIVNSINAGTDFDELFRNNDIQYADDDTHTGDIGLIHTETSISSTEMLDALLSVGSKGPIAQYFKIDNYYYIAEITVFDTDEIKEDIINYLNTASSVTVEMLTGYLADAEFMIYDQIVFDVIYANFPEYLKANTGD